MPEEEAEEEVDGIPETLPPRTIKANVRYASSEVRKQSVGNRHEKKTNKRPFLSNTHTYEGINFLTVAHHTHTEERRRKSLVFVLIAIGISRKKKECACICAKIDIDLSCDNAAQLSKNASS